MKLLVVQVSDIHFRAQKANIILERVKAIKRAVQGADPSFEVCLIAMTGDVAFAGLAEEYGIAQEFFDRLREAICSIRPDVRVEEVYVPGNHDCKLPRLPRSREVHVDAVLKAPPTADHGDDSLVLSCLEVQDNFFGFLAARCPDIANLDSEAAAPRLAYRKEFSVGKKSVLVQCFNTAWLSQLHERPGQLLAPTWIARETTGSADLVLTLFHHPLNWLEPINAKQFRRQLEHSSDVIMTGHEHVAEQFSKSTIRNEHVDYFEGAVLQDGDGSQSGFNVFVMDLERQEYKVTLYAWGSDFYATEHAAEWQPFERNRQREAPKFEPLDAFWDILTDCGAAFSHPKANALSLADIFVMPDLQDRTFSRKSSEDRVRLIKGEQVNLYIQAHRHVLILGSEKSGKTSLAKTLYADALEEGKVPVLATGEMFRSQPSETAVDRAVSRCAEEQYGKDMVERYLQLDKEDKVLIVDDFHRTRLNRTGVTALVDVLLARFGTVVLIASDLFRVMEITQQVEEQAGLLSFRRCDIQPFGHLLRYQVIKKWYTLGDEYSGDEQEVARKIAQGEKLVDTLIGKNLLPASPLFVLTILQSCEGNTPHNTELGAYGYHYEALITASLDRAATRAGGRITLDTIYTYVSHIAYRMFTEKRKFLDEAEMEEVTEQYKKSHSMRFSNEAMLGILDEARILKRDENERYVFVYRYIYYYFVAKHIASNLHTVRYRQELRAQLKAMTGKLYVEDYANIIIFLVYLTKDEEMIASIITHAQTVYADHDPCDLDTHVEFARKLSGKPLQISLDSTDIEDNNDQYRASLDEAETLHFYNIDEDGDLYLKEEREIDDVLRLNVAFKTMQIMGQILRNFPGALPGDLKRTLANEAYLLGLRALRALFALVEEQLEDMRRIFAAVIQSIREVDEHALPSMADSFMYYLVVGCAYGIVKRISSSVGSEHLEETYKQVKGSNNTLSIELIDLSIKLDHFRSFPEGEVIDINKRTKNKHVANLVLQQMVRDYFYLYPAHFDLRQSVCKRLGIQEDKVQMLLPDNKHRVRTQRPRSGKGRR